MKLLEFLRSFIGGGAARSRTGLNGFAILEALDELYEKPPALPRRNSPRPASWRAPNPRNRPSWSIFPPLACVCLAACGGGGSEAVPPAKLAFIGNSLTFVPVTPALGWDHASGMAASDAAHDYAHLVAAGLGIRPSIVNFADLERSPADLINAHAATSVEEQLQADTAGIDASTTLVVQLGDNAPNGGSPEFTAGYNRLLDLASERKALVCISTWWEDKAKDAMMQAACTAHGGRYVYIGDIYPSRQDDVGRYAKPGVDAHPHDWSMAQIAARVSRAMSPLG